MSNPRVYILSVSPGGELLQFKIDGQVFGRRFSNRRPARYARMFWHAGTRTYRFYDDSPGYTYEQIFRRFGLYIN